jgi:hypothetical protein
MLSLLLLLLLVATEVGVVAGGGSDTLVELCLPQPEAAVKASTTTDRNTEERRPGDVTDRFC